jgi:hypothetical protein
MLNTHGFHLPVYIAKGIYSAGHVADLGPLQLGIFDKKTNYVATASGNGKEFYLAGGSPHTVDQLSKWYKGMKQRKESTPFYGKDIEGFERILPQRAANEAWVIGYGGAISDTGLQYEYNKTYKLKIRLYGDPAFYFAQNSVEKIIPLYTGCSMIDDCDMTCDDKKVGVKKLTRAWAKAIENNIELAEFKIKARPIFSDYAATSASLHKYTLTVADGGGVDKLQDVQRQFPTLGITRKSYENGTSVYETTMLAAAPADFTPKAYSYPVINCDECVAGTFVDSKFTYIVSRPVSATTDLDDDAARATYVASIVTAYGGIADTGVYYGLDKGNAVVKFEAAAEKTALLSDVLTQAGFTPPICTTVAADPIAFVEGDGGYTVTRTATLTVSNEDCEDTPTLEDVQNHLSSLKNPVVVTDVTDITGVGADRDNCVSVFQVVQTSNPMQDEYCMTSDNTSFEELPNFKGAIWEEVDTPEVYDATIKAGIRITAPFYSKSFDDCSFDLNERWDAQPLRMELSIYNEELDMCQFSKYAKARRVQSPKYQRLSGAYVRYEYIVRNQAYFPYEKFGTSPRERETVDNNVLNQVKSSVYYVEYRLKYKELRDTHNFNQKKQHWSPRIFVEEGDLATRAAIEQALGAIAGKFGVELTNVGSI